MTFHNQVVWITGAGSGLGKALAIQFAQAGAHVVLSGRREQRLQDVAQILSRYSVQSLVLPCDVCNEETLQNAIAQTLQHFSQLDVVIANAGFAVNGTIDKLTREEWERQFSVNVFGLASTARLALPHLRKTNGRLVLIGSATAWLHFDRSIAYCSSKAAVHAIGQSISAQLQGSGTSCTTIHPGFVESEIAQVDNQGIFDSTRPDRRPQQLMWDADRAAQKMIAAIANRKRCYVFTAHARIGVWLARFFPTLTFHLLRRMG